MSGKDENTISPPIQFKVMSDGSMWIAGNNNDNILNIKLDGNRVQVLSSFNIKTYGLAISPSGSPFINKGSSSLQIINPMTGQFINSKYSVPSWNITSVHVTKDYNIIIGALDGKVGVVVVINSDGKELVKYHYDKDKAIFGYPDRIATTRNGTIFVVDNKFDKKNVKVVVIRPGGGDIQYYTGHTDINTDSRHFNPRGITVTTNDNILITDGLMAPHYLHILDNQGQVVTYYNLTDIELRFPFSLALSPSGNIYVGGISGKRDPDGSKATLYELKCSGV